MKTNPIRQLAAALAVTALLSVPALAGPGPQRPMFTPEQPLFYTPKHDNGTTRSGGNTTIAVAGHPAKDATVTSQGEFGAKPPRFTSFAQGAPTVIW